MPRSPADTDHASSSLADRRTRAAQGQAEPDPAVAVTTRAQTGASRPCDRLAIDHARRCTGSESCHSELRRVMDA